MILSLWLFDTLWWEECKQGPDSFRTAWIEARKGTTGLLG
jgi:hypothetical protein